MTMNGTSTRTPTRIEKMKTAATRPPTRVSSSGPIPIPRRWSSVAGIVMLFHSLMSRMNSTRPDDVDGDSWPNTASWRAYQGTTASRNRATEPAAAASGIRGGRGRLAAGRPSGPEPVPQDGRDDHGQDQHAVVARQRRDAGEQPGEDEVARVAPEAAPGQPQRARDQRLVEREVVGLDHVHERQGRERGQDPGADRHRRAARRRPGRSPRPAERRAPRSARTAGPMPSRSGRAAR